MTERARKAGWVFLACSVILLVLDFTETRSRFFLFHLTVNLIMVACGLYMLYVKPGRAARGQDQ